MTEFSVEDRRGLLPKVAVGGAVNPLFVIYNPGCGTVRVDDQTTEIPTGFSVSQN